MILGTESEGEHFGKGTGGFNSIAVWVIHVLRDSHASFRHVPHDISVVVVAWNVENAVNAHGKQTAHSARALLRAGLVRTPEVLERAGRAIGEIDLFKDDVVAIPDERVRRDRAPNARLYRR